MKKRIFFKNSKGNRLCGVLSDPSGREDNGAAVLCHGFLTGKDGRTYMRLEEILNRAGVATFRFDFFGHGESEGNFAEITVSEAVDDVLHAIEFVRETGFEKISLAGSSFGGLAALLASSKCKYLQCLALKSPVSDYLSKMVVERDKQNLETWRKQGFIPVSDTDGRDFRLNYSFFEDAARMRGVDVAKDIAVPTLIVHGDADESVPVMQSQQLAAQLEICRLEIIPGADHRYSQPEDFEKMLNLISAFLIRHSSMAG